MFAYLPTLGQQTIHHVSIRRINVHSTLWYLCFVLFVFVQLNLVAHHVEVIHLTWPVDRSCVGITVVVLVVVVIDVFVVQLMRQLNCGFSVKRFEQISVY